MSGREGLESTETPSRIEEIGEESLDVTNDGDKRLQQDENCDVMVDDTGVVVDDKDIDEMEEDLLNYDSDNDMGEEEDGDIEDEDSNANIRQMAKDLLQKPANKVLIHYKEDIFLLFDYQDTLSTTTVVEDDSSNTYPIICRDNEVNSHPSNILMATIRQFLEGFYNKIKFATKEILLNIPSLDITLCEDNIYNSQVTFDDIQTVFKILKSRSEQNNESNIPSCLTGTIELRPRFVARYNTLVELTESTATLKNIRPFSNDQSHPLVLDDNLADSKEVIVMNIDDEDEGDENANTNINDNNTNDEAMQGGNEEQSRKETAVSDTNVATAREGKELPQANNNNRNGQGSDDDDDLLEIVSDTEEPN